MEKANEDDNLDFKWLKKRGCGVKNKDVRFYESFIYDGVEYMLYDCVYMYNEGSEQPYIGKLTKIWELPDKSKKVKVHWFFRPEEISNWLGKTKIRENEIFIASGEGDGLADMSSLEAIAGPCNVVCVSNDSRNPQPSEEELKAADFIFCRPFDVKSCTILDKMEDKVGGLEIKYIFNRKEGEKIIPSPGILNTKEEHSNTIISSETQKVITNTVPDMLKEDAKGDPQDNGIHILLERNTESSHDRSSKKLESYDKCAKSVVARGSEKSMDLSSMKSKVDKDKTPTGSDKLHERPLKKTESDDKCAKSGVARGSEKSMDLSSMKSKVDKDMMKVIVPVEKVENKEINKTPTGSNKLHDQPLKKSKSDGKKASEEKSVQLKVSQPTADSKSKHEDKLPADFNNLKTSGSGTTENQNNGKISSKVTDDLEGKNLKKKSDDDSLKVPDNNKTWIAMNSKDVVANSTPSKGKSKSVISNSRGNDNNMEVKDEQSGEKKMKPSMDKSVKVSALSTDKDKKNVYREFVVTGKPDDKSNESSGWFPWDTRLKSAYNKGMVILLHNLKPDYTSEEVEDIIWHAFKEYCLAKIVPHTAVSSPHYNQALIIVKTKEAAQKILTKLDEECLMLSHERPLVGTPCPPLSTKENITFFGHLAIDKDRSENHIIDKDRSQNQSEDEAVSTSHFPQPNTIEYDMAMEWCVQQLRSEKWWAELYKQQGIELRKLKKDLQQKRA